ncbi:MAG TPA: phosphoribosylglycinamide formyltransferase [Candidatus Binatia bacterium]|nr:phosphoribosylglycinamide formyltransferase [Candidatus Binatia bacterium]
MTRLAVLVSGQGRNLQAILDALRDGRIPARAACIVSNRSAAPALDRARQAGVPAIVLEAEGRDRAAYDAALTAGLERHGVELIAMAGFMRVLSDGFIERWRGRMLNIHPSLLPRHTGLHTHRRVLDEGDPEHGASVHYVTEKLDGGPVVIQGRFTVGPQDDERTLAAKVMQDVELKIFPQALAWCARGELRCDGARVLFRGRALAAPLGLEDLEPAFR